MSATHATEREPRGKVTLYAAFGVTLALVFTLPLVWAVLRAFQPNDTIVTAASLSQTFDLTWKNFAQILSPNGSLWSALINSVIVSLGTAVLTAVIATLAGYGLSRFRFPGARVAFSVILLSMMVPFQAILTPLYLEMNALHLTDSLLGLVLFYTTVNLPFGVFVMKASCDAVPSSLEDSAIVDGAGTLRMLTGVLRPLLLPGMASAGLYAFLASWTEFLGALTFITRENLYTLPIALLNLQSGTFGELDYGLLVAGAVVAMVPCIILYVALQRFYVQGLAAGAVKG
ncbi:carbohydrate ABC transporter permease [Brachybacterium sp. ACRRE]|uniref:carbohydrate ABC transporter permease n=1 Tax=Brachybacterium sp. ACRRE TaxID=2918184 RepID=UPI001EF1A49F|nr:carbohydrate ABC transporter permease [Brachybacterium sp. ACRRE]MCG7310284.1 carbohydrate ABC transporter permease [Brachybacterium sp. ACRRE]